MDEDGEGQDDAMGMEQEEIEDGDDDVRVVEPSPVVPHSRRWEKPKVDKFRPAGTAFGSDTQSKGKGVAALPSGEDDWTTGTSATQFTDHDHLPDPSSLRYATSSDRTTYRNTSPTPSYSNLDYESFGTTSRHFERAPSPQLPVDQFGLGSAEEHAPGWISAKIVAAERGLWEGALLDFTIDDTPAIAPFVPMGSWIPDRQAAAEVGEAMAVDVDACEETQGEGYATATREEIDAIRPADCAYYSRSSSSWVMVVELQDKTSEGLSTIVNLWYPINSTTQKIAKGFKDPPAPALPSELLVPYVRWSRSVPPPAFSRLDSTLGRRIAYSKEGSYPTIIPYELMQRISTTMTAGPDGVQRHYQAILFVWRIIDGVLFKGEAKALPIAGKTFSKRLPWNREAQEVLVAILGFSVGSAEGSDALLLFPPKLDGRNPVGKVNRERMLRCWLELGLWLEDYARRFTEVGGKHATRIKIETARPAILNLLGNDDVDRTLTDPTYGWSKSDPTEVAELYHHLGVVPDITDDALINVYHSQIAYNPAKGPIFLGCMSSLAEVRGSEALRILLATERSQRHYTTDDLNAAYDAIGLTGPEGRAADEDTVLAAFTGRSIDVTEPQRKRVLHEACELIATSRGSDMLKTIVASMMVEKPRMDLTKALRILDAPSDVEEDMLLMLYDIRVEDSPLQIDTMKEALKTIAEEKNFFGILRFANTGVRPEDAVWEAPVAAVASDRPLGLTNIANTCYLNSLLQYFFTIRELRETILQFTNGAETPALNGDQLNRVGGRLITNKEVERSKRFVILLQSLYNSLIHSSDVAVTPETELAYLALVPSKEEEAKAPIETIVIDDDEDEDQALTLTKLSGPVSPSVLGKRGSDHLDTDGMDIEAMAIDSDSSKSPAGDVDSMAVEARRRSPSALLPGDDRPLIKQRTSESVISSSLDDLPPLIDADLPTRDGEGGVVEIGVPSDIEMATMITTGPPPLPPRKPMKSRVSDLGTEVSNYMTFGRQNDVTECMDNVMFQIECALNPSAAASEASTSILKKTFYGKMRQRLELSDPTVPDPVRVQEEPFFSLLVDVAEEGRTVYDGLDNVFDDSLVTVSSTEARRTVSLIEVPPILQIQLQRVQYDRVEKKVFKSNAYMQFGETITMDRYLEVDPSNVEAVARRDRTNELRRELEKARTRLAELTKSKIHLEPSKAFGDLFTHLANQPDLNDVLTTELAEDTVAEARDCSDEIDSLKLTITTTRASIEALWSACQDVVYQLSAVFIHRGTASSGHYFIYQRDSKRPERWLKYNDSIVTDIDPNEEIFRETTGDQNPYFLVYCRTNRLDAIETICRTP